MKRLAAIILLAIALAAQGATTMLNAFNGGELSPLVEGRTDIAKYYSGCRTLENMLVLTYGGASRRPGTYYIADANNQSSASRLIPFEYSTEQAYVIELDQSCMRFYKDGAQILDGNNDPYEISTPYTTADLFELQYVQSADTMYIVHNDYAPRVLTRSDHTSWTLTELDYTRGPFLTENSTTTTITPSATSGSITLTASSAIFNANHVGALWQVTHLVDQSIVDGQFTATGNSSSATVYLGQTYDFSTHGTWSGTVALQKSYDSGTTWEDVRPITGRSDTNIQLTQEETVADATYRVRMSDYNSGTCAYSLVARQFERDGVVDITAYTSTTVVTGTVEVSLGGTTATTRWAEGAWSPDEGYPSCVTFFDERLVMACTTNKPQTVWLSATDNWTSFDVDTDDDDAMAYTIASDQVNVIRWIAPQNALMIGTTGGEWKMSAASPDEPITPTNIECVKQSSNGSAFIQPAQVNNVVLYVQRQGRKVRELVYSFELDSWVAPDMTVLSEHITEGGIRQMAFQKSPDPILWAVLTTGELIGMTYNREHDVIAWHAHTSGTATDFESVAVIPGDTEDEVWLSVERTVNGTVQRFIEQLQSRDWGTEQRDAFFVDSGLTYDGGAAVTITNITQANPCFVSAVNSYDDGDQVRITSVSGMTELNDNVYTVDSPTGGGFYLRDATDAVNINSTGFTAYSSGGYAEGCENSFTIGHLRNTTVAVQADGGGLPNRTTGAYGAVTLPDYYNTVHIGLPYTAKLLPERLNVPGTQLQGLTKRISKLTLRFYKTLGCKAGSSWTDYDEVIFRDATDPLEAPPPLYTGDKAIEFDGDYETDGSIYIQQDRPLPMTLLAIIAQFETENP